MDKNRLQLTLDDPYISYKAYSTKNFTEKEKVRIDKSLQRQMDELGLKYNKKNEEDFYEIAELLCDRLQYPSSRMAEIHGRANKIGYEIN